MISPAKKHYMKTMARQESTAAADSDVRPDANQYELMMAQLHTHTQQLKNIQSIKAKEDHKATIIDDYLPYIMGVLESDSGIQDDVVVTVMLWCIDAGRYEDALVIADYVLRHDLAMPDKYHRTTACVIVEEIADAALKGDVSLKILLITSGMTEGLDMPDQVRAKLLKALGRAQTETDPRSALDNFKAALNLNEKAGVKKEIEQLERVVKKLPPESDTPSDTEE